jgi:hypothetical protein
MKLKLQVLDETNSVILDEEIAIPDEIPYAPDGPQTGPISLNGLKTAIDYALFAMCNLSVYQRARLVLNIPKDGGLSSWDVIQAESSAKTDKEKAASFVLRAVYEGEYEADAPTSAYPQDFLNRLYS